jgi:hypothetical protein
MRAYISCIAFLFLTVSWAQTITLSGLCLDENERPLSEVTIQFQGHSVQQLSNEKGFFSIQLSTKLSEGVLLLSKSGYQTIAIPVHLDAAILDIGKWVLKKVFLEDEELPIVDLGEQSASFLDESTNQFGGNLQSRRTVFLEATSCQFSSSFFSPRGLNRRHQLVRINGIPMNEFDNGIAPWSQWGGLNDITNRSQLVQHGISPFGNYFGGVLGGIEMDIRPSNFQQGFKLSQAFSNSTYRIRSMLSYHTSVSKNGWAFSGLFSFRKGNNGFHKGTTYLGYAALFSLEKQWKGNHSTWITTWYSPTERGRNAPLTEEVFAIKGNGYNPYWGIDQGKLRNARVSRTEIPHFFLNHELYISEKTSLLISASYKNGEQGSSRLLYTGVRPLDDVFIGGGRNPDPVYYQNLPSYFLRDPTILNRSGAYIAEKALENDGQIDWESLRQANQSIPDGSARYALYEDAKQEVGIAGAIRLFFDPRPGEFWNTVLSMNQSEANYFAQPTDLLGAKHLWDIDPYAQTSLGQLNNVLTPNSVVEEEDPFLYHYGISIKDLQLSSLWSKQWEKVSFFIGGNLQQRSFRREGFFQNGGFPETSFGPGEAVEFNTWSAKTGFTIALSGRHRLSFNGGVFQVPPSIRSVYPNPRENHTIIPDPIPEDTHVIEGKYHWESSWFDLSLTTYWIEQQNQNNVSFYFADGVGVDEAFFVQEVLKGVNTLNQGVELGWKITLADVLDIKIAGAYGRHQYANSPALLLFTEPSETAQKAGFLEGFKDFGSANLKGLFLPNGPQQAYSLGLQYNDPNYWRISITGNYFSKAYLQPNPLRRTASFLVDSSGLALQNVDEDLYRELLKQEQFPAYFVFNATGGKSWKVNQQYFGFFVSLQNLLNTSYKTGGFEQGRNANYALAVEDAKRQTPLFSPKYWWGRGPTFFCSIYYRF